MTKTKFYESVAESVSEVLGSEVIVELQEVTKVNLFGWAYHSKKK